jgi:hypothetical protein
VGPGTGLNAVEKIKILHCWESNQGLPARSPLLYGLSCPGSLEQSAEENIWIEEG